MIGSPNTAWWWMALAALILVGALAQVHLRSATTLLAYELGAMKAREAELLEERSLVRMQILKLTARPRLEQLAQSQQERLAAVHVAH